MGSFDISAEQLRAALNTEPPDAVGGASAAVAVVFSAGEHGTELLFIQRASKDTDPWSGHMAFPGGRTEPADRDSFDTAQRETLEEVGLDLTGVTRLGSLDDLVSARDIQAVHALAYWLDGERPTLQANYEVADIVWVPLSLLGDPDRHIDYHYRDMAQTWPGIQLDERTQVVWGLTLRFLDDIFRRLGLPFIELVPRPRCDEKDC